MTKQKADAIAGPLLIGAVFLAVSLLGAANTLSQSFDRGANRFHRAASNLDVAHARAPVRPGAEGRKPNPARRSGRQGLESQGQAPPEETHGIF